MKASRGTEASILNVNVGTKEKITERRKKLTQKKPCQREQKPESHYLLLQLNVWARPSITHASNPNTQMFSHRTIHQRGDLHHSLPRRNPLGHRPPHELFPLSCLLLPKHTKVEEMLFILYRPSLLIT